MTSPVHLQKWTCLKVMIRRKPLRIPKMELLSYCPDIYVVHHPIIDVFGLKNREEMETAVLFVAEGSSREIK
ncbi:hypothetical protein P3L10_002850 [Capsicum annuum]